MSYEEAMEMITDTNNGAIKSFYLVKTVKALTLDECEELNGWNEWFSSSYALDYTPEMKAESEYFGDKTIYEVEIVRDLLRSADENGNMYVAISMGNPLEQREGDPAYCPGEMFTVAVYEPNDNSEIYSSCGGFMLRYDVTVSNGDYFAYSRNNYELDALNIDGSENIDESAVTSTTVNPVRYSQKAPLEKLAEFIKNDWTQRGIAEASDFTVAAVTESSAPKPTTDAALPAEESSETLPDYYTLETAESTLESSATKEAADIPKAGSAYYDKEFKGAANNTGAPMSYEDVMNMLKVGENEHGEHIDSFFLVETVKALSLKECKKLAGWSVNYADRTVYKVNVLKDLISGEDVHRTEYIFVSMGNAEWQNTGDPIYAPGEKFTVVLTKPQDGCDFLRTPGSFMFRYDVVETAAGDIELYGRSNPIDAQALDSAETIDEQVITSTTLNPARHTQKIGLTQLAEFIRTDWQQRGLTTAFNKEA